MVAIIGISVLYLLCNLLSGDLVAKSSKKKKDYITIAILFFSVVLLISVVLELVAFIKASPHYDNNLTVSMDRTMNGLRGCGGPIFEKSLNFF